MKNSVNSTFRHGELAAELTAEIASGRYPIGGRFPTEQELQARFEVGRHTIREAMKVMTEQGLLDRRRKTGTTVLSLQPVSQYVHSLRDIRSLFDFAQNTQLDVRYQGFASMQHPVPDRPGLESGRYFRIAGVRSKLSSGKPLCWTEILIPERYAPDRNSLGRGDRAIYELVVKQHGLKLEFVEQEVSAMDLPPQFAELIDAEGQTAALMVRRRYFTPMGEMFEMTSNLYPGRPVFGAHHRAATGLSRPFETIPGTLPISTHTLALFRLSDRKVEEVPATAGSRHARVSSPVPGRSILMTVAPRSPRIWVQ